VKTLQHLNFFPPKSGFPFPLSRPQNNIFLRNKTSHSVQHYPDHTLGLSVPGNSIVQEHNFQPTPSRPFPSLQPFDPTTPLSAPLHTSHPSPEVSSAWGNFPPIPSPLPRNMPRKQRRPETLFFSLFRLPAYLPLFSFPSHGNWFPQQPKASSSCMDRVCRNFASFAPWIRAGIGGYLDFRPLSDHTSPVLSPQTCPIQRHGASSMERKNTLFDWVCLDQ